MIELIAISTLFISLVGMGMMILRKIPLLLELPATPRARFNWRIFFSKFKSFIPLRGFPSELLLQKILSKIRVLTLKTDSKTSNWLQRLRERTQKKKFGENDNYWQEVRKSTKK